MITVYTTGPQCHKCNLTKRALDKGGVEYTEVRLDLDPALADSLKARGFVTAPVVQTETEWWQDFRIDKIRALIKAAA